MANTKKEADFLNRIKQSIYQRRTYWIGFLIILVTYVAVFIVKGIYPFGEYMILGDSHEQCLPFMSELHRKLLTHESLQYSWAGSMGTDFISIIAYYLSSPLSFYYIFFTGKALYGIAGISTILKAVLCYTSMYYYLVKRPGGEKNVNSMELVLFAGAYVLNNLFISYNLFYPFQDVMILFPLVMLGLEQFVAGKGRKLYFVTLIMMIMTNYYLGAMVCLFIILYYFTLSFGSIKNFLKISIKVLYTSLLALGCTAILLIPVVMALQQNSVNISEFLGVGFLGNWFDTLQNLFFLSKPVMSGSNNFAYSEANMYTGILVAILALCFLFNKKVALQVRIRKFILLGILVLSLNESLANYIMHMFHYTNGMPNRQMIFLLFLSIGMGHTSFKALKEDSKNINKIFMGFVLLGMIALLCFSVLYAEKLGTIQMYVGTFGAIVVYGIFLLLQKRFESPKNFVRVLVVLGVLELLAGTGFSYYGMTIPKVHGLFSDFYSASDVKDKFLKDEGFYHIVRNNTYDHTNMGFLVGYHGIESFSSVIPSKYVSVLAKMGNNTSYNMVLDFTHTSFLNSLLNVKYIVSNDVKEKENQYSKEPMNQYAEYMKWNEYSVYENETVLSPVILSSGDFTQFEKQIDEFETNEKVDFGTIQASLLEGLCKNENADDMFSDTEIKIDDVKTENCTAHMFNGNMLLISSSAGSNTDSKVPYDAGKDSRATIFFTAQEDGDLYLIEHKLRHFGEVKKGEQYSFDVDVYSDDFDAFSMYQIPMSYKLYHDDVWKQAYNQLATQQMEITEYTDSSLEGYLSSDGEHKVFTSIPYDKNWKIYVDGKRVKTDAIADAFLSFTVGNGEHQVRMVYSNPYILVGILISLLSVFVSFLIWQHNRKK